MAEFIELYGPADFSLEGFIAILVNGADDASSGVIDLTGQVINKNGFSVIGNTGVPDVDLTVELYIVREHTNKLDRAVDLNSAIE